MFSGDKLLRIPGPTPVPERVISAIAQPMIGHRSSDFVKIFKEVQEGLKRLFVTSSDVLVMAGSGTLGMESAVSNLLAPGEPCVVAVGGKFGERWVEIAEAFGARPIVVEYPYGEGLEPSVFEQALKDHPEARTAFVTQNESSTAVMNDIRGLAAKARAAGVVLVVDAVSSLGGTPLPMDEWGVDVVVTGSQKCLMLPPGLAFVAVGERAWEKAKARANAKGAYYADWFRYQKSLRGGETPYTPAVSLVRGLQESLCMLEEEGAERRFKRHQLMKEMVRAGLAALGFRLYVSDRWASPTLTAASGGNVDIEAMRKAVKERTGVVLSGGQGELKGEIFRIGHMGAATPLDMVATLAAVELGMEAVGARGVLGRGTTAAMEVWRSWL